MECRGVRAVLGHVEVLKWIYMYGCMVYLSLLSAEFKVDNSWMLRWLYYSVTSSLMSVLTTCMHAFIHSFIHACIY